MTHTQEAAALREIAAALLLADERATSLARVGSEDTAELIERVSTQWCGDADALLHRAHELAPTDAPLPLFAWMTDERRAAQ